MKELEIWTDGGCNLREGYGGCAAIIFSEGDGVIEKINRPLLDCTNNIAELMGVKIGIEWFIENSKLDKFKHFTKLCVVTDSRYCEGLFTRDEWNAWQFMPSKNLELVFSIRTLITSFGHVDLGRFRIRRVKGHSGVLLNELADIAASEACLKAREMLQIRKMAV